MKLTNRLKGIADLISEDVVVGDIGSDHGYLIAYLIENKIISKGIASDINEGPVQNCMATIRQNGMTDKVSVRLGGGFLPYKENEIHTAVIAGMGGQLIRDIFIESQALVKTVKRFILQPMTGQDVLRRWLVEHDYKIEKEVIEIEQNRYYEIMVVSHGIHDQKKAFEISRELLDEIGYSMVLDSKYQKFLQHKLKKYTTIEREIEKHTQQSKKLDETKKIIKELNEVLSCIPT